MRIRGLNFHDQGEVNTVAAFSLMTLLESLPEARRDPDSIPNFSIDSMASLYLSERHNPDHRYWVVDAGDGLLVGHAIGLMRTDDDGVRHGYSYTRYVLPRYRRRGIARQMLQHAKAWWHAQDVAYVLAHTHPSNTPLLNLFASEGFSVAETRAGPWPSLLLRCPRLEAAPDGIIP
jgi:ribosomal protein S18 acetylase RimI-like enzyme